MMLMPMRLQKSQLSVPAYWKYDSSGAFTFKRAMYCMAGYTKFDVMVVSGAGGRSGNSGDTSDANYAYASGGGGGGGFRRSGLLSSLPAAVSFSVGASGGDGANSAYNVKAPNGGNGGSSSWNGEVAQPGKGGIGGRGSTNTGGEGGPGGYGPGLSPTSADTPNGVYDAGLGAFSGGSGGVGEFMFKPFFGGATFPFGPNDGGDGAVSTGNPYRVPGLPAGTHIGGKGGGVNVNPFTLDGDFYYGTRYATTGIPNVSGGCVLIKIS